MAKYDKELKINYDGITKERTFFDTLRKTKSARYDWGKDIITTNGISISGEYFIHISRVHAFSAADIVIVLLYNDIDVTIDINYASPYATFKNDQQVQTFMKDMRDNVQTLKGAT